MNETVCHVFGLAPVKPYKGRNNPDKAINDTQLIGMELEVENLPLGQEHYAERAAPFWTVVADGSLRPPGQAWEFVSKPATIGLHLAELRLLFERFKFGPANYSDRCSIHVHANVQDFTKAQIANLALIYPVFETALFHYVNRFHAPDAHGYNRDTNLYCIPWNACRMNRNFIEKFMDAPGEFAMDTTFRRAARWEKYTALNLLPIATQGTVEWRHLHGTADMEKITTWLNVIGSIMHYCKSHEFDQIVQTIKIMNDVSTYQQFFQDVLAGTLPYNEEYRQAMSEGVIGAKYSLVNWEANKGKEKPKAVLKKPAIHADVILEDDRADDRVFDRDWQQFVNRRPAGAAEAAPGADLQALREQIRLEHERVQHEQAERVRAAIDRVQAGIRPRVALDRLRGGPVNYHEVANWNAGPPPDPAPMNPAPVVEQRPQPVGAVDRHAPPRQVNRRPR